MASLLFVACVGVAVYGFGYSLLAYFLRAVCKVYFRRISVHGINNLPRDGPVIVCSNHPNMFVDALLVLIECHVLGRSPFVWVKGALFKNPLLAKILHKLGGVPVYRPPKKDSLEDSDNKSIEEIAAANALMFKNTWDVLNEGNLMVLFPEGTSYTQAHMLKLKTGVMRVAAGFVTKYGKSIPIIPVGLTYFKKESFRSEVLLEFGRAFEINHELLESVELQNDEKIGVKKLTDELEARMHRVTLNAPDFETLRLARCCRHLYLDESVISSEKDEVEFTRELISLFAHQSSQEIDQMKRDVKDYQSKLDEFQIKDHDLLRSSSKESIPKIAIEKILYLLILLPLGIPGILLNFPLYLTGRKMSELAYYTESKSMFKIVAASVLIPAQWLFLILCVAWIFGSLWAQCLTIALPLLLYSHIRVLEEGRSTLENVIFLINLSTRKERILILKTTRSKLVATVRVIVGKYASSTVLEHVTKVAKQSRGFLSLRNRQQSRADFHL